MLGAMLPQMKVKNEKGEEVEVSTLATDTGVVIFTAPKADTREYWATQMLLRSLNPLKLAAISKRAISVILQRSLPSSDTPSTPLLLIRLLR